MPAPRHEPTAPDHLLTIAEYAALGETEPGYAELVEGRLLMSPSPAPDHNVALFELAWQLRPQLPERLEAILHMDVDLQLDLPEAPGFSRRPDLIVVERTARQRVRRADGMIRASEVVIAVEVVSRGSKRIDRVHKRADYEEARIPWYWILDIDGAISLVACRLDEQGGYREQGRATGAFTAAEPFPVKLDLDGLI